MDWNTQYGQITIHVLHFIETQDEEKARTKRTRIISIKRKFDLYNNCQFLTHGYQNSIIKLIIACNNW